VITRQKEDTLSFKFSTYQTLHQAIQWRVIKKMVERIYDQRRVMEDGGWPEVNKIYKKLCQPSPSFHLELPHDVFVEKRYDIVNLGRGGGSPTPPFEVELLSPGHTFIEEIGKEVVIEETNRDKFRNLNEPPSIALMDCENLQFPLKMRNFRPGDRFHPLGVKGSQKLKDFFIDHKVPKFERPKVPLLISGEMIAWIVGHRIDERVKVTERTKKIIKITVG
jgi:tRNA(Ile)-lysidine synthase